MNILVYHYQFKPKNSFLRENLLFCSRSTSSDDSSILTNENIERDRVNNKRPIIFRRSHRGCSVKIGALKNCANFIGKHLCWSLFLIKFQTFSPATLLKKESNTDLKFFEICKIFKNIYLKNITKRLLLHL